MRRWITLVALGLVLTGGDAPLLAGDVSSVATAAAADIADDLQTGSLLFTEGDCLAIRAYTASPYTHVAIVCLVDGRPMVYDSMNGIGVRKLSLADYLATETPSEVHLFHPRRPLTTEQGTVLRDHLESQLGRPYAIHHHLTGRRSEGLHCSEYATDALMAVGLITAQRPSKVSPASLVAGITQADIYHSGETVELVAAELPPDVGTNRCHQLWIDTKRCTLQACDKLTGWFLCR